MIREYLFPNSIEEAIGLLEKNQGCARLISGGTDLILDLAKERVDTEILVDVTRIRGFHEVALREGWVEIAAGATMAEIAANELVNAHAPALALAAAAVGSSQIRNSATLAGNIVRAQPAADTAVMLAALGAWISVVGADGSRDIPVQESYLGIGQSAVDPTKELVAKIRFPKPEAHQGTAYVRLAQRKALALPMLNVGAMLSFSSGCIEWARIVMGPVGAKPTSAAQAERYLAGKEPSGEVFQAAAALAACDADPRSSYIRGSREYRLAVLPSLVAKALHAAHQIQEVEA